MREPGEIWRESDTSEWWHTFVPRGQSALQAQRAVVAMVRQLGLEVGRIGEPTRGRGPFDDWRVPFTFLNDPGGMELRA